MRGDVLGVWNAQVKRKHFWGLFGLNGKEYFQIINQNWGKEIGHGEKKG